MDAKIVTDLSDLARNRAISEAVLVGGDEDLRIGMELAQQYGVRVHLLTLEGSTCSTPLRQEADTHSIIATAVIRNFLSVTAPPATTIALPAALPPAQAAPSPTTSAPTAATTGPAAITTALNAVVTSYLSTLAVPDQAALKSALQTGTGVPSEHDGRLLATARAQVGRPLENHEKTALRGILKAQLGV